MAGRKDLQPQHDGGSSITQSSQPKPSSGARPYTRGADVMSGPGAKPSKPAPASQPKQDGY